METLSTSLHVETGNNCPFDLENIEGETDVLYCVETKIRGSLLWRHNGRDGVSNHQPHNCLLNHLFRCRSKKTSKLRVTVLHAENSPVTGEFAARMEQNHFYIKSKISNISQPFAKLQTSFHSIGIERGRYRKPNNPGHEGLCLICTETKRSIQFHHRE